MVTPGLAITNGEPDGEGHPNVGTIVGVGTARRQWCTGTLVSPRVFLTAAHCVSYLESLIEAGELSLEDNLRVSFDADNAYSEGLIPVLGLESHPDYRPSEGATVDDVGVVYLRPEDTTGISPATLPAVGYLDDLQEQGLLRQGSDGADFVAAGYGGILEWPPPVVMDSEGIRRVAVSEFSNLRKNWLRVSQNQAPGNQNGGTCWGDSGGPNFWVEPDGSEVLVAVTTGGDPNCVEFHISQRTDTPSVAAFIAEVMAAP